MKLIPLKGKYGEGKFAKVDDEDYDKVKNYSWYVNEGYVITYHKGKRIRMHRLIMNAPNGVQVDHIHHDKLDHCKSELRLCTQAQNNANVRSRSNTGFKSVYRTPDGIAVKAYDKGKTIHIGLFKEEDLLHAAVIADLWNVDLHGPFAKTNFPIVSAYSSD